MKLTVGLRNVGKGRNGGSNRDAQSQQASRDEASLDHDVDV